MIATARRYGIIAGSGMLPVTLAERLVENGDKPVIVGIAGEVDAALRTYDFKVLSLAKIAYALPFFKQQNVTHIIFAGGVQSRPKATALRVPLSLWPEVPAALVALKKGDDGLLGALVRMFERHALKVIGAHEILQDHVAQLGVIIGGKPAASSEVTIHAGVAAARMIGQLDIGQAVVALGRRVIAVEGLEGTDQMLARILALRSNGRINSDAKPVLIKIAKPRQELRVDMPVIGPQTVNGCKAAGIELICVSAESTMIMEVGKTLELAKKSGISIYGLSPEEWGLAPK